jgi:hypothetical protein
MIRVKVRLPLERPEWEDDMPYKNHKSNSNSSESRDVREFFGKTSKKPEPDDKPKRTPRDRNTGSSLKRKLAGKVIG